MDDESREHLAEAAEELQERGKESMKQHGDLNGTEELGKEPLDPLASDPDEAERALQRMRDRAIERKREADKGFDKMPEMVGE
jgi:hypothetical protein